MTLQTNQPADNDKYDFNSTEAEKREAAAYFGSDEFREVSARLSQLAEDELDTRLFYVRDADGFSQGGILTEDSKAAIDQLIQRRELTAQIKSTQEWKHFFKGATRPHTYVDFENWADNHIANLQEQLAALEAQQHG